MRELISNKTVEMIQEIESVLFNEYRSYPYKPRYMSEIKTTSSLKSVQSRLILLNNLIETHELKYNEIIFERREKSLDWLFYEREIEIVPIYNEALALVEQVQILPTDQIQSLLYFTGKRIPDSKNGIKVENHDNKGYHFHYGVIKKDKLIRYDVLLTFDKADVNVKGLDPSDSPLYIEPHSVDNYVSIDASTIGHNRRYPIYLVCQELMLKRGIQNFMSPSNDSWQFYPIT